MTGVGPASCSPPTDIRGERKEHALAPGVALLHDEATSGETNGPSQSPLLFKGRRAWALEAVTVPRNSEADRHDVEGALRAAREIAAPTPCADDRSGQTKTQLR